MPDGVPEPIERAFARVRQDLEIRDGFPDDVRREAERVAAERVAVAGPGRVDRTDVGFVTIDPPGSRDLDQAVHAERAGDGYRLRYAIADVGFWIDRGGAVEQEAWRRGVTYYAPDHRAPLYPEVLSQGAASLLPEGTRPAVLFDLTLDARAEVTSWTVERALVRSRAQLTYAQLLEHAVQGSTSSLAGAPWAETLTLLAEIGPKRLEREAERGGVSLPVRDQHVQRSAATTLGYELAYEAPNAAEAWNAQVSLLTGHVAALRMMDARVGLLRTMPPFGEQDVAKFRRIARTLGFAWPAGRSYADFMHGLQPHHPRIEVLVRQARRVMRGADYVAFDGELPAQPLHGALAFVYAHVTAPLRRLADRYVLDLLVTLSAGARPAEAEVATLRALVPVMDAAERRTSALERQVVDLAEAWTLRDRVGEVLRATAIDVRGRDVEVQVEQPPLRATLTVGDGAVPALGEALDVRLAAVDVEGGHVRLEAVG
ncbi:RNB domain-containing ribonuclease [Roseisolibacter agri]|uniref:Ribonuclease R n=1 Tax=Roseisolibacter agri TaxID=2014610 RepID=A0AA37QFA5_9BACT|nr:RNB domain-containing ribonuclease [Roseisolibacter agri]GLC27801.1 ribonuclease R [Roseisolibacter agri]